MFLPPLNSCIFIPVVHWSVHDSSLTAIFDWMPAGDRLTCCNLRTFVWLIGNGHAESQFVGCYQSTHWDQAKCTSCCKRHFYIRFLQWRSLHIIRISLIYVPNGPINNKVALVQKMTWWWTGDKLLFEPMMALFTGAYMRQSARRVNMSGFRMGDDKSIF